MEQEVNYNARQIQIKITEKEYQMMSLMTDILGENKSEMVRRLLLVEAQRCVAYLDDEEIPLWLDLLKQIEVERDYMLFQRGEKISEGRRKAYKERTGVDMDIYREREMDELKDKQREWQRARRRKLKMQKLKELQDKHNEL